MSARALCCAKTCRKREGKLGDRFEDGEFDFFFFLSCRARLWKPQEARRAQRVYYTGVVGESQRAAPIGSVSDLSWSHPHPSLRRDGLGKVGIMYWRGGLWCDWCIAVGESQVQGDAPRAAVAGLFASAQAGPKCWAGRTGQGRTGPAELRQMMPSGRVWGT